MKLFSLLLKLVLFVWKFQNHTVTDNITYNIIQVNTGMLLLDGEKEALEGSKTVYFPLFPERSYKEGSAAQIHFRLAESQFYRLLSGEGHSA